MVLRGLFELLQVRRMADEVVQRQRQSPPPHVLDVIVKSMFSVCFKQETLNLGNIVFAYLCGDDAVASMRMTTRDHILLVVRANPRMWMRGAFFLLEAISRQINRECDYEQTLVKYVESPRDWFGVTEVDIYEICLSMRLLNPEHTFTALFTSIHFLWLLVRHFPNVINGRPCLSVHGQFVCRLFKSALGTHARRVDWYRVIIAVLRHLNDKSAYPLVDWSWSALTSIVHHIALIPLRQTRVYDIHFDFFEFVNVLRKDMSTDAKFSFVIQFANTFRKVYEASCTTADAVLELYKSHFPFLQKLIQTVCDDFNIFCKQQEFPRYWKLDLQEASRFFEIHDVEYDGVRTVECKVPRMQQCVRSQWEKYCECHDFQTNAHVYKPRDNADSITSELDLMKD